MFSVFQSLMAQSQGRDEWPLALTRSYDRSSEFTPITIARLDARSPVEGMGEGIGG